MKHFLLFLFFLNSIFCHAQNLFPVKRNGLFGYCNKEKEIIIPFQFEDATDFDKNFAIVTKNNKEGLINKKGEFIIPPNYYSIDFRSLYFEDSIIQEVYTLQKEGEDKMQTFIGKDQKWIKKKYENVEINTDQSISFFKKYNSRIGRKYKNGKTKLIFKEKQNDDDDCDCWRYYRDYYVQLQDSKPIYENNKMGFRNIENSPAYLKETYIEKSHNGHKDKKENFKVFLQYINIPPIYDSIKRLNERNFLVRQKNKYGIVDNKNQKIIPIEYDSIIYDPYFYNGFYIFKNGLVGVSAYSHMQGLLTIMPQYQKIERPKYDFYLIAEKENKLGLVNLRNKIEIPFEFKKIELRDKRMNFVEVTTVSDFINLYDMNKQRLYFPDKKYISLNLYKDYSNGELLYQFYVFNKVKGKDIFFPAFKKLIPIKADSIVLLSDNLKENNILFKYKLNEHWGLMKVKSENETVEILAAKYDNIVPGNIYGEMFQKGFISVELKSKNIEKGYIDIFGNEYFPDK